MKVGDTVTFEGVLEPDPWWRALRRRLGLKCPPRELKPYVITHVVHPPPEHGEP